jgi:cobyrinic acid a,c-diamide synthase
MGARLVVAGTQSGVGKTTLTAGIITALRRRGLIVQPFKVGPDYIDPTYHTLAAGRPCRNLDTWMVPPERVRCLFSRAMRGVDVAIIEGVMGLYDGAGYDEETGSTSEVAKLLEAPVFVVLDASKLARSAGAIALGFQRFDDGLPWGGFIINCVASEPHGRGVAAAVARATGLPVLGWLPRKKTLCIPERHLGLVPTCEPGRWLEFMEAAGDHAARHLDLDRLLAIAQHAPPLPGIDTTERRPDGFRPVIAVARDEAFHFTYEDNLDLLRVAGAEIVFFSPLHDAVLPARTAGIILSGGFPEFYAAPLAANRSLHAALHAAHQQGLPIYAECGGLMYLTQALVDGDQREHAMVGLLPGRCVMSGRLTLGYRLAQSALHSWFLREGETIRGHEFHYSVWEGRPDDLPPAYFLLPRSEAGAARPEGAQVGNLWASYVHVHLAAKPELAARFVAACRGAEAAVLGRAPGGGPWV